MCLCFMLCQRCGCLWYVKNQEALEESGNLGAILDPSFPKSSSSPPLLKHLPSPPQNHNRCAQVIPVMTYNSCKNRNNDIDNKIPTRYKELSLLRIKKDRYGNVNLRYSQLRRTDIPPHVIQYNNLDLLHETPENMSVSLQTI